MGPRLATLTALASSLLLLLGVTGVVTWRNHRNIDPPPLVAIEHGLPLTVSIKINAKGTMRLIDVDQEGDQTVFVSVPAQWQRAEARRARLADVTDEAPAAGFVRWTLPPRAGVTFRAEGRWRRMSLANPSGIPLTVRVTSVDLERERAEHNVVLVKDETVTLP